MMYAMYLACLAAVKSASKTPCLGTALLLGISPTSSGLDLQGFIEASQLGMKHDATTALQLLAVEYGDCGVHDKFTSIVQGTVCVIGCANKKTQEAYRHLGLETVPVGGAVGKLDCHFGGVPGSCSEISACICFAPCSEIDYKISCMAYDGIVTVNGKRVLAREEGDIPLQSGYIVSVGARVFSFITAVP